MHSNVLGRQRCLSPMTRHNLREHLTWLLGSENAAPPLGNPSPPQTHTASSTTVEEDSRSPYSLLDRTKVTTDVDSENVGEIRRLPEFVPQSLPARSGDCEASGKMARLQAGPRLATKSRLLSQASPALSQTPTPRANPSNSSSLKDQYSAYYGDNITRKCLWVTLKI